MKAIAICHLLIAGALALFSCTVFSAELSGNPEAPNISSGGSLFSAPVQCNRISQITQWNGGNWTCLNDNFYVPPPAPVVPASGYPYRLRVKHGNPHTAASTYTSSVRAQIRRLSHGRFSTVGDMRHYLETLKPTRVCVVRRLRRCKQYGIAYRWVTLGRGQLASLLANNSSVYNVIEWWNLHRVSSGSVREFYPPASVRY